jgi:hypothetical protein
MMQIRQLILYGKNGKVRNIPFELGQVNIITGKSKSGKSAIGDIIEYCLGGDTCNIADGVIRENVSWYGLLLQFEEEQIFVSRKNPEPGQQSTSYCYVKRGKVVPIPERDDFTSNENVDGLEELLSQKIGISENLNVPPEGQSRNALTANIRHALYYCFQNQDEIAAKNFLFHRQAEDFITQSIKDTMPYFMGIINEDALEKEKERSILKRKIVLERRRIEEKRMLQGGGIKRGTTLLAEAKYVGLLSDSIAIQYDSYDSVYAALKSIYEWSPISIENSGMDRLSYLQTELDKCLSGLLELDEEIKNAKKFAGESRGYLEEAGHQKLRLSSIGLFEKLDFRPNYCPLCSKEMVSPLPDVEMIKTVINNLDKNIENVEREKPKLRKYIDDLEDDRQKLREEIQRIRNEIDGIYLQDQEADQIRDLNARRAKVVGRISLWLESVGRDDVLGDKENEIMKMEERLKELNEYLDKDAIEDRKQSILSRISIDMTEWAKQLCLEHSDNPYRLDMNKVTVVVDKEDRPVPLKQMGSGSNWVGIHLITYFALQKFFIKLHRPVPRFLFLDQPSQVYFPSELDEKRTDIKMVNKLYDFIIEQVSGLIGELQVIIVDHVNLGNKEFTKRIVEDWWGDDNLVPTEWYEK